MIKIVTENYFLSKVRGKDYIKQQVSNAFLKDIGFYFFEIPEKDIQFMFLSERQLVISFSEKIDENEVLDFSDWELTQVSDIIPKIYTINSLKRVCNFSRGMKDLPNGAWRLENKRIGETFEFATMTVDKYWVETRIGFPEKLEPKVNIKLVKNKTIFIENILHGLRENNQGSDIQS